MGRTDIQYTDKVDESDFAARTDSCTEGGPKNKISFHLPGVACF